MFLLPAGKEKRNENTVPDNAGRVDKQVRIRENESIRKTDVLSESLCA